MFSCVILWGVGIMICNKYVETLDTYLINIYAMDDLKGVVTIDKEDYEKIYKYTWTIQKNGKSMAVVPLEFKYYDASKNKMGFTILDIVPNNKVTFSFKNGDYCDNRKQNLIVEGKGLIEKIDSDYIVFSMKIEYSNGHWYVDILVNRRHFTGSLPAGEYNIEEAYKKILFDSFPKL